MEDTNMSEETQRPAKKIVDPNIQKIDNRSVPVMTEGKITGGNAMTMAQQFAFLMQKNAKHGGGNKSHNFKEAKKANIRRNEKNQREYEK